MSDHKITFQQVKNKIKKFVRDRDWEQYHSPKNLSMSIAVEAAELMEHFQWITPGQSRKLLKDKIQREEIEDELADIAIYVIGFCNISNIDLEQSILRKLSKNAIKYPVRIAKGRALQYTYCREHKKKR